MVLAYEEGYKVLVMECEENLEKEKLCFASIMNLKVSGLLITPDSSRSDFSISPELPIVKIELTVHKENYDILGITNMMTSSEMTKCLVQKGKPTIRWVKIPDENFCENERAKGYRLATLEFDQFQEEHILLIEPDADSNPINISNYLLENPTKDALFCTSSNVCNEVLGKINRMVDKNHIKHVSTSDNNKWFGHIAFPVDAITSIAIRAIEMLKNKIVQAQPINTSRRIFRNCNIEGNSSLFRETISGETLVLN